ncbi:hypothetical protein [uncultured Brachyspira sp.]|uniref:hypothetical protein n=1 Tax=uncultured Brachyspira sp. TaxID=221953 RepID=UPI0025EFBD74|nr:hypothetical protein [uncultured Brachyspira sp.]
MSAPVSQIPSRCPSPTSYSQPVSSCSSDSYQGFGDWIDWPPSAQGSPVEFSLSPSYFSQSTEDSVLSSPEDTSELEYQSILDRQRELLERIQSIEYQILIYQQELASLKREKSHIDSLV